MGIEISISAGASSNKDDRGPKILMVSSRSSYQLPVSSGLVIKSLMITISSNLLLASYDLRLSVFYVT